MNKDLSLALELVDTVALRSCKDPDAIVSACRILLAHRRFYKVHAAILYHHKRPLDRATSYHFLRSLMGDEDLPPYLRIYCHTISSYKAVEMDDREKIVTCIDSIPRIQEEVLLQDVHSKSKRDVHHLFFSTVLSNLHLYFASRRYRDLKRTAVRAVEYLESIRPDSVSSVFYGTSVLVARCLGIAAASNSLLGSMEFDSRTIELLRDALSLGLSKADRNPVRFAEFMDAMKICNSLILLHQQLSSPEGPVENRKQQSVAAVLNLLELSLRASRVRILAQCRQRLQSQAATPTSALPAGS